MLYFVVISTSLLGKQTKNSFLTRKEHIDILKYVNI